MSGTVTTYQVVEPHAPIALRARLIDAAISGATAPCTAVTLDDPSASPETREFSLRVETVNFGSPEVFNTVDGQTGEFIQFVLTADMPEPVTFTIIH